MYFNIQNEDNAHVLQFIESSITGNILTELKVRVMQAVSDNKSVILSFENVDAADEKILTYLPELHEEMYHQYHLSFVICSLKKNLHRIDLSELNITPTREEALDIVNMEVIERELLG